MSVFRSSFNHNDLQNFCFAIREADEIGKDIEGIRALVTPKIREMLMAKYGPELDNHFEDAVRITLKAVNPVAYAFSDKYIRGVIGNVVGWYQSLSGGQSLSSSVMRREREDYFNRFDGISGTSAQEISDAEQLAADLEFRLSSRDNNRSFKFGIEALDRAIGNFLPGEICIITGAPGSMKTSLALCALDWIFWDREVNDMPVKVIYGTAEMSRHEIALRILERESRYPENELREMYEKHDSRMKGIIDGYKEKYSQGLVVMGNELKKPLTLDILLEKAQTFQPDLIIMDYLTAFNSAGISDLEFTNAAMRRIKDFSQATGCSFMILSQMSKQDVHNGGGAPKGGGIVEEIAHHSIVLERQVRDEEKPLTIARINKSRRGIKGQAFDLIYEGACKRFTGDAFPVYKPQPKNKTFYERAPSWCSGLAEKKIEKAVELNEQRKDIGDRELVRAS
jgi:KaiC/GvpD/RAD55 family RecA-like ATPase